MKKDLRKLFLLGELMAQKYASIDGNTIKDRVKSSITTAILNASTGRLGIMPFMKMLIEDQASLNVNVTRQGNTITVSPPSMDKPELTPKYAPLSSQIKGYLEKNLELYPTVIGGEAVDYSNVTVTLEFASPVAEPEPIAAVPQ